MRPVWAEVDLNAIAHNLREVRRIIPKTTKIMAIVKANAYGHGAFQVAQRALETGADYLGVALLAEAVQLREHGIASPIMILGYTSEEDYPEVIKHAITQTVFTYRQAQRLSEAAQTLNQTAKIHIKVDTGMGRIGFQSTEQAIQEITAIAKLPGIEIEGLFTHMAKSDAKDKTYSQMQLEKFLWVCREVEKAGVKVALKHAANSGAIIDLPEAHLDIVRPGIMLYGLYPSDEVDKSKLQLQPAMSLKAKIVHLKEVEAGTSISYGCTFTTKKRSRIATLPLGYADGYTRLLSNKGVALVRGCRVPVVGRVCMDQCMLDVSDVESVAVGDEVVLLGRQGEAVISVDEVAESIGTINYEVVCMVSYRVPRKYI
ncbi:alanine racemase [Zhaonella formicivorans]|uniref:alanine racemase n=1 Tax=Zhaonella formicivorans TaxID=2528593 RepID=UPI001D11CAF5|nr:alanine racemase [Zhaonella formicivorans]